MTSAMRTPVPGQHGEGRCHNRSGSDAFVVEFPDEQDQTMSIYLLKTDYDASNALNDEHG
jgi:hypothetical protein